MQIETTPETELRSIEETLRETSHSLDGNQTLLVNTANHENVMEYEKPNHKVEIPVTDKPTPSDVDLQPKPKTPSPIQQGKIDDKESNLEAETESVEISADKPMPKMRIAEREKEKWNNPVKIKNNPYAPENLVKRINEPFTLPRASSTSADEDAGAVLEDTPQLFEPISRENSVDKLVWGQRGLNF